MMMSSRPSAPPRVARNVAEKQRRDKLNAFIADLANHVPLAASATKRLDKTSILRLASCFLQLVDSPLSSIAYNWTAKDIVGRGLPSNSTPNNYTSSSLYEARTSESTSLMPIQSPKILSSDHVRSLMEGLEGFLIVTNCDLKLIYVAQTCEKFLGHQNIDMMGFPLTTFIHPGDVDVAKRALESAKTELLQSGNIQSERIQIRCRMKERSQPRTEVVTYQMVQIVGTFILSDKNNDNQTNGSTNSINSMYKNGSNGNGNLTSNIIINNNNNIMNDRDGSEQFHVDFVDALSNNISATSSSDLFTAMSEVFGQSPYPSTSATSPSDINIFVDEDLLMDQNVSSKGIKRKHEEDEESGNENLSDYYSKTSRPRNGKKSTFPFSPSDYSSQPSPYSVENEAYSLPSLPSPTSIMTSQSSPISHSSVSTNILSMLDSSSESPSSRGTTMLSMMSQRYSTCYIAKNLLFKGFVQVIPSSPMAELSLIDANQEEYVTRLSLDGVLLYADHRISTVIGYMPDEVVGRSAYAYILVPDHVISLFAHKLMLSNSNGTGIIVHRLRKRTGEHVYLQSAGCLQYDRTSGQVDHFICVSRLLHEEEGDKEREKFVKKFTPHVSASDCSPSSLYESLLFFGKAGNLTTKNRCLQ